MSGGNMLGSMRHTMTVEARSFVPDGHGGFDEVWTPLTENATLYAHVVQVAAGEVSQGGGIAHQSEYKIITTYRSDIVPGMRLSGGEEYYNIVAVLDRSQRKEYLEIRATSQG